MLSRLREVFGPHCLDGGVFYLHDPALRFELSRSGANVAMFVQAFDRAREVLSVVFGDSERLTVVMSGALPEPPLTFGYAREHLRSMEACGVRLPRERECTVTLTDTLYGSAIEHVELAFEVPARHLPGLLWGVLAKDLGVRPRFECRLCLADVSRGVLVSVYDDRGMDVIGWNHALLRTLYVSFGSYLLEYDRERMNRMFRT